MRDVNKSLLCKQAWNLKHGNSALTSSLKAHFMKNGLPKKTIRPSFIWPGIRKMWSFISSKERQIVGNGKKTNLWNASWLGDFSIVEASGNALSPIINSTTTVFDIISNCKWTIPEVHSSALRDAFFAAKLIRLTQFDMEDQYFWSGSTIGAFSTSSAWNEIRQRNLKVPWFSLVWNKMLQPRQSVFGWRLMHGKMPMDDIISQKGIPLVSKCYLCGLDAELKFGSSSLTALG
ncbi:uncharacterized protein LOC122084859 [Macadamia integrifolia]|uniref:uncharacterized protein LOC122084859 n=1 Tax=Macadamia integrifolia TaxID=60698 RepID=UPI001C4E848A|nr:uncharacterized protein LOC122084859 [Macadamia integrifolia]